MPFVSTPGIRMWLTEAGQGDPLLLIMGITAPGSVWAKHTAAWQHSFRCLMPDNRGVGRSGRPAGPYTTAVMADDHAALLDALGIPRVRVVGVSMGGAIAQQLALRHPKKVQRLVLCCPWARCDVQAVQTFAHLVACRRRMAPGEFAGFLQWLIFSTDTWRDPGFQAEAANVRRKAGQAKPSQSIANLVAQAAACVSHDTLAELSRITCPTLVLGGQEDRFTPPWMAREVAAGIPGSSLHLYRGAGHAFHWERLQDFNQRVATWLKAS